MTTRITGGMTDPDMDPSLAAPTSATTAATVTLANLMNSSILLHLIPFTHSLLYTFFNHTNPNGWPK